jgi:hypothetical protein
MELNGKVSISFFKHPKMHLLLKDWMAPKYIWAMLYDRFVTVEEYEELWKPKEQRYEEGWHKLKLAVDGVCND